MVTQGSHTPFWEWDGPLELGKIALKLGKNTKFYALKFLLSNNFNLHGIVLFSEEQVDKQSKQIVNQCNNNRAICVCLIFSSSFL